MHDCLVDSFIDYMIIKILYIKLNRLMARISHFSYSVEFQYLQYCFIILLSVCVLQHIPLIFSQRLKKVYHTLCFPVEAAVC